MTKQTGDTNQKRAGNYEKTPVILTEVADEGKEYESIGKAAAFLGVPSTVLHSYVLYKTKVIKSKIDGKTYLIRRKKPSETNK